MYSLGQLDKTVLIQRRKLLPPTPGSAEPQHSYLTVATARVHIETHIGVTEFAKVSVNGKQATHTIIMQFTTIPFDIRDRVRDAKGNLYQILSVENISMGNQWLRLRCADQGFEGQPAAR